jgi:hypothetical protein
MDCVQSTLSIHSHEARVAVIGTHLFSAFARSFARTFPMTESSWGISKIGLTCASLAMPLLINFLLIPPLRFYAEYGERIDHQRFSFRSLTDLVRAIPSVVVFYDTGARRSMSSFSFFVEILFIT